MVAVTARYFAGALCVCLALGHFVAAAPQPNNYEGLRELYQQLLEAGAVAGVGGDAFEQQAASNAVNTVGLLSLLGGAAGPAGPVGPGVPLANHQLVRKSNRTPSLRLRYGRRSDPAMKSSCFEQSVDES